MQFELFPTKRLLLRKLDQPTLDFVFTNYDDEALMKFLRIETPELLREERAKHKAGLSSHKIGFLYFQMIDPITEKIIGSCGFHTWFLQHRRAEIGYSIYDESFKGKGLMTEAMEAIIDYGFDVMNLHRIEALISDDNVPSLKLVERFNFKREGYMREHYLRDGIMEDSVIFSLLKQERIMKNE